MNPSRSPRVALDAGSRNELAPRLLSYARDGRWACMLFVGSLPWMMLAHSAVNKVLFFVPEPWRALAYPETLAAIALNTPLFTAAARGRASSRSWRVLVSIALATGAWFAFCAWVQGAPPTYWTRRLGMEWVVGPLLGLAFHRHLDELGWKLTRNAFCWSLLFASVYALGLYFVSFGLPSDFHDLVATIRTYRAQLTPRQGVYFGWYTFGGINDVAAYFAIGLTLYLGFLAQRGERSTVRFAVVPLALGLEFLCYSRGAILGLLAAGAAVAALRFRSKVRVPSQFVAGLALLLVFAVAVIAPPGAVDYWRGQTVSNEKSTAALRVRLWSSVLDAESVRTEFEKNLPGRAVEGMREAALEFAPTGPDAGKPTGRTIASDASHASTRTHAAGEGSSGSGQGTAPDRSPPETSSGRHVTPIVAELIAPLGSGDGAEVIRWSPVSGAEAYYLYVGSNVSEKDLIDSGETTATSWPTQGLPTDRDLFVRINTRFAGVWRYQDILLRLHELRGGHLRASQVEAKPVDLSAFPPAPALTEDWDVVESEIVAELLEPHEGAPAGEPVRWTRVRDAEAYYLWIGTTPGTNDVVNSGETLRLDWPTGRFPEGTQLFIQINTKLGGVWRHQGGRFSVQRSGGSEPLITGLVVEPIDLSAFPSPPLRFDSRGAEMRDAISAGVGGTLRRVLFGYGTGNYGLIAGATPDMGVHNIFLESFLSGGAAGLVLFGSFWIVFLYRLWRWTRLTPGGDAIGVFVSGLVLTLLGVGVSVRLENLGTLVLGTILWWLASGPYGESPQAIAKLSAHPAKKAGP